jgi:hypothetical protein
MFTVVTNIEGQREYVPLSYRGENFILFKMNFLFSDQFAAQLSQDDK